MAFTTPPTFARPAGDPAALRDFAAQLISAAASMEQVGQAADRFAERGSELYWDSQPDDVFWGGAAQVNYVESMVRRLRLMEFAGTNFRAAGAALAATADHLQQAQMGVDEAQSIANQRATADAISPAPTTFEQEQAVVSTSNALVGASAGEAAAKLRSLAAAIPGYVAPAVSGAGTTAQSFGASAAPSTDGLASSVGGDTADAGTGPTTGSSGGGGTGAAASGAGATSTGTTDDASAARQGPAGGGPGGVGAAAPAASRGQDDDDAPARVEEA